MNVAQSDIVQNNKHILLKLYILVNFGCPCNWYIHWESSC